MPKKNNPGCNCCDDCEIFDDDFNRVSLGSNWSADSGSWTISSNKLAAPSNGVLFAVPTATSGNSRTAQVVLGSLNYGDIVRLIMCASDADNYMAVEAYLDPNTFKVRMRLINRTAGSDTVVQEQTDFLGSSTPTMVACWDADNNLFGGQITGLGGMWDVGTEHGQKAGIEVQSVTSATFDDWKYNQCSQGVCVLSDCTRCTRTAMVQVEVTNLGDGVCTVDHPTGTYLVPYSSSDALTCTFFLRTSRNSHQPLGSCGTCQPVNFNVSPEVGILDFTVYINKSIPVPGGSEWVQIGPWGYEYSLDTTDFCTNAEITGTYVPGSESTFCASQGFHTWDFPNATVKVKRLF